MRRWIWDLLDLSGYQASWRLHTPAQMPQWDLPFISVKWMVRVHYFFRSPTKSGWLFFYSKAHCLGHPAISVCWEILLASVREHVSTKFCLNCTKMTDSRGDSGLWGHLSTAVCFPIAISDHTVTSFWFKKIIVCKTIKHLILLHPHHLQDRSVSPLLAGICCSLIGL